MKSTLPPVEPDADKISMLSRNAYRGTLSRTRRATLLRLLVSRSKTKVCLQGEKCDSGYS